MAFKPAHPQALQADKAGRSAGFDKWLSLFYNWIGNLFASITGSDVLIGNANPDLPNARVATDTTSVDVDIGTAGQVKWIVLPAGVDHGGLAGLGDNDHPQYLLVADIDDTPVNGEVAQPISSNWAYDHVAAADPHTGYRLESDDHNHQSAGAQAGQLDHGLALTGLGDDDHAQYVLRSILTTNGDLFTRTAGAIARLGIGTNTQVLTVVSGAPAWADATGGGADAVPETPGGRVTLTTATPVMVGEAATQTTIYYTPYVHDQVPLYNGTQWTSKTFTELSIVMASSANWASGSNYDLYVCDDGGTLRLVTGAAWTNDTTRSESLTRLNGRWVNGASMTGRYAASSTVTVDQYEGLYVGTFRASANGTTTWELGGIAANGDPGLLYVWNCYNRVPVGVGVGDSTDSWTYATATVRASNASNSMRVSFVRGMDEDEMSAGFTSLHAHSGGAAIVFVGLDSTSAMVGAPGNVNATATNAITAHWRGIPGLGYHYLQALEYSSGATGTFYGDAGAPTLAQSKLHVTGMF